MTDSGSSFRDATIRLTVWYVAILALLSLLFSSIVFTIARNEIHRPFEQRRSGYLSRNEVVRHLETIRVEYEEAAVNRLIRQLVLFNLLVISAGGLASYYFAKHTLRPVEEAAEAQARFASDAAHELRTPLAVMQSEIEVGLRDKKPTLTKQRALLESSLSEVENLRGLTDRLLTLTSQQEIELTNVRLDEVTTDAINRIYKLAAAKSITVAAEIGNTSVRANPEVLADVLTILLDNAVKYSPEKSKIKITSVKKANEVKIAVSDNGPGIAEVDLPHIFDRFYRSDVSRSRQHTSGHGLGLAIAKRSVEMMQGSIGVENRSKKGAVFTLAFATA